MWSDGWPAPWIVFGPMLLIVFAAICVAMMSFIMRDGMSPHSSHGIALDILRARYARGEIDQAEFEERRRLLGP